MGIMKWLEDSLLTPKMSSEVLKSIEGNKDRLTTWYQNWQSYYLKKQGGGQIRQGKKIPEMVLTWEETPQEQLRGGDKSRTITFIFTKRTLEISSILSAFKQIRVPIQCVASGEMDNLVEKYVTEKIISGLPHGGRQISYPISRKAGLKLFLHKDQKDAVQKLSIQYEKNGSFLVARLSGIRSSETYSEFLNHNANWVIPNFNIEHHLQIPLTQIEARLDEFSFLQ